MNPNSEQKRIVFSYNRGIKNEIVLLGDELYPKIISEEEYKLAQTKKQEYAHKNGRSQKDNGSRGETETTITIASE